VVAPPGCTAQASPKAVPKAAPKGAFTIKQSGSNTLEVKAVQDKKSSVGYCLEILAYLYDLPDKTGDLPPGYTVVGACATWRTCPKPVLPRLFPIQMAPSPQAQQFACMHACSAALTATSPRSTIRSRQLCPTDTAINIFLFRLGYKSFIKDPVQYIADNPTLRPFIQRVSLLFDSYLARSGRKQADTCWTRHRQVQAAQRVAKHGALPMFAAGGVLHGLL
jgi:hypothetical protein